MDYNIYIHSAQSGTQSQTSPWKHDDSPTSAWLPESFREASSGAFGVLQNPDSLIARGTSALLKAVPAIASSFIVVKAAANALSLAREFATMQTGDYSAQVEYANFVNALNWAMHPFSNAIQMAKTNARIKIEDQKRSQERLLYGDAVLNELYGRGV